jgi:hypothetical protein
MIKLINLDEVRCVKSRPNYTFSINKPDQLPNVQFVIYLKGLPIRDSNSESGLTQERLFFERPSKTRNSYREIQRVNLIFYGVSRNDAVQ